MTTKYENVALLIHPMYSIVTDIYRNVQNLGTITFKELEPEYMKRLKLYKESIIQFKNTNTLFVIVEPTKDLINFKLEDFYGYMIDDLYSFARKELGTSFKIIKDNNYVNELKKLTPHLRKNVGVFPFGEHREVCVKSYNEFTINYLREHKLKPVNQGIQTKFSFDIEHKLERARLRRVV